jgi:hypothetical protein
MGSNYGRKTARMLEVATPEMAADYTKLVRRENLTAMFAAQAAV